MSDRLRQLRVTIFLERPQKTKLKNIINKKLYFKIQQI
jgi:hypothetical protein